jgi:hypothetical protein
VVVAVEDAAEDLEEAEEAPIIILFKELEVKLIILRIVDLKKIRLFLKEFSRITNTKTTYLTNILIIQQN